MTAAAVLLPLLAAIPLGFLGGPMAGAWGNLVATGLLFLLTLAAWWAPGVGMLHADQLGLIFGTLTGFVGLTTAISNLAFVRGGTGQLSLRRWRAYHAMSQVLLGCTLLGLYADNIGLLWVAVEGATIAACVGVSLTRTASALEAAWKYFILGGVGIALALFGTMVTYLAAQPALGPGLSAMSFSALAAHAGALDGRLMTLAFICLLFGYGTKAALAPLHGWLPDAYAEGPGPLSATLSGLMLNVPLLAILRFRHLMRGSAAGAMQPGPLLVALGLASLLLTAFSLWRRRDARRFFGFSSIEHSGLATFAFGVGGAPAIFAGLLHMLLHTLIKSALFQALTRAASLRGGTAPGNFGFARLHGLLATNRGLAWLLGGCLFALTGLPPSGLFTSEFLIVSQTIQRAPWLSFPLGVGIAVSALAVIRQIGPLLFAPPAGPKNQPAGGDIALIGVHLAAVLLLAFAMPWPLLRMLSSAAGALQ